MQSKRLDLRSKQITGRAATMCSDQSMARGGSAFVFAILAFFSLVCQPIVSRAQEADKDAPAEKKPAAKAAATEGAYLTLPFDKLLQRDRDIPKILRGDADWPLKGNEAKLDKFFTEYVFAKMTDPELLNTLPGLRQEFYKRQLWAARSPEAFMYVNELTLKTMTKIIAGEKGRHFHPAVRYNAVLIIGDLDLAPRTLIGQQVKPKPWPNATGVLVKCLPAKVLPDYIKAGALVGLRRHAELGIPNEQRLAMTGPLLTLVQQGQPPANRDAEVHAWMRGRACEILGFLAQPGGGNEVPQALVAVLSDPKAALGVRCAAAQALGQIRYDGDFALDAKAMITSIGELAMSICDEAKTRAQSLSELNTRRVVASRMARIHSGLTGIEGATKLAKPENRTLAKELAGQADSALVAMGKPSTPGNLATALETFSKEFAAKIGKSAAGKTAPETPGDSPTKTKAPAKTKPQTDLDDF